MRDTGGGFGQKVHGAARGHVPHARRRRRSACPVKWIEDRRENLLAGGQVPARARPTSRLAFDADGADPGRQHRLRVRLRRLPDAVAGRHRRPRSGCCSPARTGCRRPRSRAKTVYTNTVGRTAVPRAVAVRDARPRGAARHRRAATWASIPSSCAAATCCASDELPYANPNGMTYDSISPLETFEQALAMLDYDGLPAPSRPRRRAAGRYLGVGVVDLRRADDARARATTAPRRRRSASSRPAR